MGSGSPEREQRFLPAKEVSALGTAYRETSVSQPQCRVELEQLGIRDALAVADVLDYFLFQFFLGSHLSLYCEASMSAVWVRMTSRGNSLIAASS